MSIKEVSRRVMCNTDDGITCGPISMTTVDAEIAIDDDGRNVFLHVQWANEAKEFFYIEGTSESIYDLIVRINSGDEKADTLLDNMDRIRNDKIEVDTLMNKYYSYVNELVGMILEKMENEGLIKEYFPDEDGDTVNFAFTF